MLQPRHRSNAWPKCRDSATGSSAPSRMPRASAALPTIRCWAGAQLSPHFGYGPGRLPCTGTWWGLAWSWHDWARRMNTTTPTLTVRFRKLVHVVIGPADLAYLLDLAG